MNVTPSPANTLSLTDPGDDTQRRYRYQAFYAALISLELLIEDTEFEEVFCEHHEDTLIKKKNGKFVGIQVKTRQPGRDPFKADEEQIINSLCRFVEQDIQFPDCFEKFIIATNYTFWNEEKENSRNLYYLISLAQEACINSSATLRKGLSNCVNQIKKCLEKRGNKGIDQESILDVLQRIELEEELPKFDDIESRLAKQIPDFFTEAGETGYDDLLYAARGLINRMFEAGSLQHVSGRTMYFSLFSNHKQMKTASIIDGKRISKTVVEQVLKERIHSNVLFSTRNHIPIEELPKGFRKTELKMAAGKVSANNIRNAKDYKYSTETLLNRWIHKYGTSKASRQFDQLKLIISSECQEVYDQKYSIEKPFGHEMLIDVRERIRNRITKEPDLFFRCTYEHLLGVVGILTEMCEVWWSEEFDIPSETMP